MYRKIYFIIDKKFIYVIDRGEPQHSATLQLKTYKFKISILLKYILKRLTEKDEIGNIEFNIIEKNITKSEIVQFRVREKIRNQSIGKALLTKGKEILIHYYNAEILTVCPISDPYPGESYLPIKDLYHVYQKLGFQLIDKNADLNNAGNKMFLKLKNLKNFNENRHKNMKEKRILNWMFYDPVDFVTTEEFESWKKQPQSELTEEQSQRLYTQIMDRINKSQN